MEMVAVKVFREQDASASF